mgnify:CR=1 FL=1
MIAIYWRLADIQRVMYYWYGCEFFVRWRDRETSEHEDGRNISSTASQTHRQKNTQQVTNCSSRTLVQYSVLLIASPCLRLQATPSETVRPHDRYNSGAQAQTTAVSHFPSTGQENPYQPCRFLSTRQENSHCRETSHQSCRFLSTREENS